MTDQWIMPALAAVAIVAAIIAGIFITFSDFVMRSLGAAQAKVGIEAMQEINRKVYGSLFLVLLMGMVPASAAIIVLAGLLGDAHQSAWLWTGGIVYLTGVFLITVLFNVPMNKRLDRMAPESIEAGDYWPVYVGSWTRWNHVRSIASLVSAVCFLVGAILSARGMS